MLGTLINVAAVVLGSCIGLLIRAKMPSKIQQLVFDIIGLFTVLLGLKMALEAQQILVLLLSLLVGGVVGEWLNIDGGLQNLGNWVKLKLNTQESRFTEGLVSAFLLFCIGPLTILGCIEEGLGGYPTQLYTKSVLDGFSSVALSSAMGVGVLVSALPLLIFQASITFLASYIQPYISESILTELTATGGLMVLALGLNILNLKQIKVANLLPALLVSFVWLFLFG